MSELTVTETFLKRERWIVASGLVLICALSWAYLLAGAGTGMSAVAMSNWQFPPPAHAVTAGGAWDASYWLVMFSMSTSFLGFFSISLVGTLMLSPILAMMLISSGWEEPTSSLRVLTILTDGNE